MATYNIRLWDCDILVYDIEAESVEDAHNKATDIVLEQAARCSFDVWLGEYEYEVTKEGE